MGLFKKRWVQFTEHLSFRKKEESIRNILVKKYKERDRKNEDYEEFKKSLAYTVDKLFSKRKSKIIIKPNINKIHLYEQLILDEDFKRYYHCEVKSGNQLVIQMVEI